MRLLFRNRCQVGVFRLGMLVSVTLFSISNTVLAALQQLVFGRRLARTEIKQQPIFIIGHWRSGTTLLHELLAQDPRHTYPTTYECFSPQHFLLTEKLFSRWFSFLLPQKRLQDNIPLQWHRPQEDEFALCNLGERSPMFTVAFPNRPPQDQEYLDMVGVPREGIERWKQTLRGFLTKITLRRPQRILLKSPQHTCRIETLLEMFPDARFVYIVRDPYAVYASTMNLWRVMYTSQGFQTPRFEGLHEHVLETFERMHQTVERTRGLVPAGRFSEVHYEDLVREPMAHLERIYHELELGDFAPVRPGVEKYLAEVKDYQTNRYHIEPEAKADIARRWAAFFQRHGYERA
jgi:hypothetical protein